MLGTETSGDDLARMPRDFACVSGAGRLPKCLLGGVECGVGVVSNLFVLARWIKHDLSRANATRGRSVFARLETKKLGFVGAAVDAELRCPPPPSNWGVAFRRSGGGTCARAHGPR